MQQLGLFVPNYNLPGLNYIPSYISEAQAKHLIEIIDAQNWLSDLTRRVQHYGYKYDYTARAIDQKHYIGSIPDWLVPLCVRLFNEGIFTKLPDQVIINEYLPGQGIAHHIDCIPCFDEVICSLSLISSCVMEFIKDKKLPILLEQNSLLILSDQARYEWKHGISSRKQDIYQGSKIKRERRVSITFRNVKIAKKSS